MRKTLLALILVLFFSAFVVTLAQSSFNYSLRGGGSASVLRGSFKSKYLFYSLGTMPNTSFGYGLFDCYIVLDGIVYQPNDPWLSSGEYRIVMEVMPGIENASVTLPTNATPPFTLWMGIGGSEGQVPWNDWAIYNVSGSLILFVNVAKLNITQPVFLYLYMGDPSGVYPSLSFSAPNTTASLFLCSVWQRYSPTITTTTSPSSVTSTTVTATPNPTYGLPGYTITINIPTPPPITLFHPSIPTIWTAAGLLWLAIFLALFVGLSRLIPWYTALVIASFVLMTMAIMMWTSYSSYAIAAGVIGIIIGLALTKTRGGY